MGVGWLQPVEHDWTVLPLRLTPQPNKKEVEIQKLEPGDKFRVDDYHGGWTYGLLLFKNACRAQVQLPGQQKQVMFDEGNGNVRVFDAQGRVTVTWPLTVLVEYVDDVEWEGQSPEERSAREMETTMTEEQKQAATALQARYSFGLKQLAKAKEAADEAQAVVLQKRLDNVIAEAEAKGITLHDNLSALDSPKPMKTPTAPKSKEKAKQEQRAKNLEEAKKPAGAVAKTAKPTTTRRTHNCICGCKKETFGLYAPGHDARVKGILLKVERGEMDTNSIPEDVQPFVKYKGKWKTDGYTLIKAPVKIPGRDNVENSTQEALEALDV